MQATKYWRFPGDLILLVDLEAATVDVWNKDETQTFTEAGPVYQNGKPLLSDPNNPNSIVYQPFTVQIPNVPIFDRLYLGGSNNLRGFAFRDVGPKDSNNQPIGGQSMARGTVELTFPIIEKARGAIFYDTGFVNPDAWDFGDETLEVSKRNKGIGTTLYNQFHDTSMTFPASLVGPRRTYDSLASDFGVGVRLDLPIGPLRLDYGFPIQKAGNAGHGHLNFSVGYQF